MPSDHRTAPRHPWYHAAAEIVAARSERTFTRSSLTAVLRDAQVRGMLPDRVSPTTFVDVLREHGGLRLVDLPAVPGSRARTDVPRYAPLRRYVWGTPTPYEVALALRPRSYLSHGSALALNGLTSATNLPIYVNQEQRPKPSTPKTLEQTAIDRAFRHPQRTSQYVFRYEQAEIVLVNGKSTGNLGVVETMDAQGARYLVTGPERTLIDIAVRPVYAGGVGAVLEAYRRARATQSSTTKLVATLISVLDGLDHVYPYHQAVGFYLERAGATPAETAPLRERGLARDFYLAHQIVEPAYDAAWRIYHPSGLR